MRSITICLLVLGVLAVAFVSMPMRAQNQTYPFPGFPPEFSPLVTSRPAKPQRSLVPPTKFVKVGKAIPNRYIVVLNDDVVSSDTPLGARRAAITAIANSHALAHLGKVGYVYETALKGYSIELPNEAAAIAISQNPQVKWVEEDGTLQPAQAQPDSLQYNPPWGLYAIGGAMPGPTPDANGRTAGPYIYNADGTGVNAYVIDSGINTAHQDFSTGFYSRASEAADCIKYANCQSGSPSPFTDAICVYPVPNTTNNDCFGHGTHVAGTLGGNTYGVAKNVTIKSVKVCTNNSSYYCPTSAVIQGVNWVTSTTLANPGVPAIANMSLGGDKRAGYNPPYTDPTGIDSAVSQSINLGVTYVVSAPDANDDASNYYPADVDKALTVGSVDWTGSRDQRTGWGNSIDLFAPGVFVLSALSGYSMPCNWFGGNAESCTASGTSMATPHVAGAVAMYLQGRTGTSSCNLYPIQGVAPSGGDASSCPDRVARFIDANANLSKLSSSINGTVYDQYGNPVGTVPSANRFLSTRAIPITPNPNPIKNQRFFVWQHYADFITTQPVPDENGLNFWTSNITGCGVIGGCPQYNPAPTGCGTGFNDNNPCTDGKRVAVSLAFWVSTHSSWFNGTYGLTNFDPSASSPCGGSGLPSSATPNEKFLDEAYCVYLRRRPAHNDTTGFNGWLVDLNTYGVPASAAGVNHIISAFLLSTEYKQRFGQP